MATEAQFIALPRSSGARIAAGAAPSLADFNAGVGATDILTATAPGAVVFSVLGKVVTPGLSAAGRLAVYVRIGGAGPNICKGEAILPAVTSSASVASSQAEILYPGGLTLGVGDVLSVHRSTGDAVDVSIRLGGQL